MLITSIRLLLVTQLCCCMRKNDEEEKQICSEEKREDSHERSIETLSFAFADMHVSPFCGITLKTTNENDVNDSGDSDG